ncbi:hypothetical protein [uncultured Planktosalinus sp.]|uniref:hypothetical protein n=1 Tax=uncultured Planktosalinus sp. TaxID=1810935 RepID=UPI0030DB8D10
MNLKLNKFLIIILIGIVSTNIQGQEKFEKESRLKSKDVPKTALNFIEEAQISGKVKWYIEYGLETTSIEAKFKMNRKWYSVEFDTLGIIEDVEIEIKFKDLKTKIKKAIESTLNNICETHKIFKIQKQFSGDQNVLISVLKQEETQESFDIKYELVAKCVKENKSEQFEFLFSDEGQLINTSKIIFKKSNNLEY